MRMLPNIASRLFGVPLLMAEREATALADAFNVIIVNGSASAPTIESAEKKTDAFASTYASERYADKPYVVTDSGIGILPVYGPLVQRRGQISPDCTELASYQRLGTRYQAMLKDRDVKAILLEVDSPGGEVAGCFDLAGRILGSRSAKPIWGHANEFAFSAGYALVSATSRVVVARTGMVGSIGVIWMHVDQSAKDEKAGYKFTTFKSGARKDDFSSHKSLSKPEREWADAEISRLADVFFTHSAEARPIDLKAIREMEAGCFSATDSRQNGLADDVANFDETLEELEKFVSTGTTIFTPARTAAQVSSNTTSTQEEPTMSDKDKPAAAQTSTANPTKPDAPTAPDAGTVAADAKARIKAITTSEHAKGRETLAQHFAFETDMTADAAIAALQASPKAAAGTGALASAMSQMKNPAVGADAADVTTGAAKPRVNVGDVYAKRREAAYGAAK